MFKRQKEIRESVFKKNIQKQQHSNIKTTQRLLINGDSNNSTIHIDKRSNKSTINIDKQNNIKDLPENKCSNNSTMHIDKQNDNEDLLENTND